jgi:hypothetical protein
VTAEEIVQIQRRVMRLGRDAKEAVADLQSRKDSIMSNTQRLTPQARQQDVAMALGEGRARIMGMLEDDARGVVDRGYAEVERTLGRLQDVDPEELAASERNLRVALNAASQRPELLLNLYRQRHLQRPDRLIVEGTASGMIDALGDSDNYAFRDAWNSLQQELSLARGPEELEALSQRAALDELSTYLDNLARVVGADLALMDPSISREGRDSTSVARAMAEAVVNEYETLHASVMDAA